MPDVPDKFRAFVVTHDDDQTDRGVQELTPDDLPDGDVTIHVEWSSANYKDALASTANGQVAQISPLVPGIDLAGEIVEGRVGDFGPGEKVVVTSYQLGVGQHGGYAEYARVPADWVVPLPVGLTTRSAMILGTAGFTAALSVHLLEEKGLYPGSGPVLVTGASGGVGSIAIGILGNRGYEVVASSGKEEAHDYLKGLGASEVVGREEASGGDGKPLAKQRWAGAVDTVGTATLPYILSTLRYGGAVAASGLTSGVKLETTVLPFILRGVSLLGADSVNCPMELRHELWERLGDDLRPNGLDDAIATETDLDGVERVLDELLQGAVQGRTVVRVGA